uniref:SCP domain-containing protein n=1 Tax=Leersia perrieri TaxID=77586 RepID=A0A0D9VYM4_9ORYZ
MARLRLATIACVVLAALAPPAFAARTLPHATTTPPPPSNTSSSTADEYLTPHNQARAAVGVPPLTWSTNLATTAAATTAAQQQRGRCEFADMGASQYGANQGWASYPARPGEVVAAWVAQGRYYAHGNNSCAPGQQCGTYTQVVWRRTSQVGCAQATCATGATLTVCLYYPHGNVQGQSPY